MILEKDFRKLSVKEKVEYFDSLGVGFIAEGTAEKVEFKFKDGKTLICFYNNTRCEWAVVKDLKIFKYVEVEYKVITANGNYDERADLLPIKQFATSELFIFEENNSYKIAGGNK